MDNLARPDSLGLKGRKPIAKAEGLEPVPSGQISYTCRAETPNPVVGAAGTDAHRKGPRFVLLLQKSKTSPDASLY
ncbi:MAG: hypothetical protein DCC46_07435 [Armatimonadetes bacterium]|nr:MAG: hypothetical protein DCC46_07435 [Armatimonadota bacterium]